LQVRKTIPYSFFESKGNTSKLPILGVNEEGTVKILIYTPKDMFIRAAVEFTALNLPLAM